ncbi:MAG: hypothetical protein M3Z31_16450 [Pseudomonadota bacterium]|nr:hypothetical protein [Pseudomonadota bacterium]
MEVQSSAGLADFHTTVGGRTTNFASLPVAATVALDVAVTVELACYAGSGHDVTTQPSILSAIKVATLNLQ